MRTRGRATLAWVAIYSAIVAVTSYVPLIPYVAGGGFLPLSIPIAALAPVVLGFGSGILAALVGGIVGSFINPATYPYGIIDAFFVGMAPAIFSGLAFRGFHGAYRWSYVALLLLSGMMAELVPYYVPGSRAGFGEPPQPFYALLVLAFVVPWLVLYLSPIGTRGLASWLNSPDPKLRFAGALLGGLTALFPWSLWMIAPGALLINLSPEVAIATWFFAAYSRTGLAIIFALIAVPLLLALGKSGMPAPADALWKPRA